MDQKSPDAFRTISEVADWLDTPAHVLRFWESRFPQVKPVKRAGGRRYYRPSDMALLGGIKRLLHEDGMTIRGVQKMLKADGVRRIAALSQPIDDIGAPMLEDAEAVPAEVVELRAAQATEPAAEPTAKPAAEPAQAAADSGATTTREHPPAPPPESPSRPDLAAIPAVPADEDPRFAPRPPAIPQHEPAAIRARLTAHPARAAAIYARLAELASRMESRPR